ncbi:MAG TPA: YwmB family TATA-box binding protein [Syntrophomonadaceae bacterium]|nr:YwmB family TATA-box binding protein [Syntrophomonadaceae bacterium]
MKNILTYIIFFCLFCTFGNYAIDYSVGQHIENQSPYYLSFASIGVNSLESHLDCWAKIKTTSSQKELESYLCKILESLNLPIDQKGFKIVKTANNTSLQNELSVGSTDFSFILESDELAKETYFIISIVCKEKTSINEYQKKLNSIIGLNWEFYYQYEGNLDLVVNQEGSRKLLDVMMTNLKISDVKLFNSGATCSCTGFSKDLAKIAPSIKVDQKPVNVQIAIQVDKIANKTNIIVGSPLILSEY